MKWKNSNSNKIFFLLQNWCPSEKKKESRFCWKNFFLLEKLSTFFFGSKPVSFCWDRKILQEIAIEK